MTTAPTDIRTDDDQAAEHQRNRKDVIREGFKNKTRGEAWFNGISYIGVGYGLVTAFSVFLTWAIRDTKFATKFEKFAETATKKHGIPRSITSIATLFLGGTIASVLPVKWLEDSKPTIVKKLDRMIYDEDAYNDPKIKAAHKELDELPKQTWLSVFGSRVVAFAATFSVFALMGSNKSPFAKATGHSLDELSIRFGRGVDRFLNKNEPEVIAQIDKAVATNLTRMKSNGDDALHGLEVVRNKVGGDRVQSKVWSYIGIDAIYTLITSVSLFVSTRILGGLIGKPQTPKTSQPSHTSATSYSGKSETMDAQPQEKAQSTTTSEKPSTSVGQLTHLERLTQPAHTAQLTT